VRAADRRWQAHVAYQKLFRQSECPNSIGEDESVLVNDSIYRIDRRAIFLLPLLLACCGVFARSNIFVL
jgi:hypothetical protein